MNHTLRNRLALLVVLLATAVGTGYLTHRSQPASSTSAPPAPSQIVISTVRNGVFVRRRSLTGHAGSPQGNISHLTFAQAGLLSRIEVEPGDQVTRGQRLAELDRRQLTANLEQAQAGILAASAPGSALAREQLAGEKLRILRGNSLGPQSDRLIAKSHFRQAILKTTADVATLSRDQTLYRAGIVAQKELDAAESQVSADRGEEEAARAAFVAARENQVTNAISARSDVSIARGDRRTAEAQRSAAQAQFHAAEAAYQQGVLRASIDGTVVAVNKHVGESVDAAASVIDIAAPSVREATLIVPSDLLSAVHLGDAVTLHDAQSMKCDGRISRILTVFEASTQSASAIVSMVHCASLLSGEAVTAIVTLASEQGIIIPSTAVVTDPESGHTVVFVHRAHPHAGESSFEQREVKIVDDDTHLALIGSGLHADEQIARIGAYTLLAPNGG
jgi:multidrug efflux pump subunit AcrA (membrane-fusion protein)